MVITMDDHIQVRAFKDYDSYRKWCIDQVKNGRNPDEIITQDVFQLEDGEEIDDKSNLITDAFNFQRSLYEIQNTIENKSPYKPENDFGSFTAIKNLVDNGFHRFESHENKKFINYYFQDSFEFENEDVFEFKVIYVSKDYSTVYGCHESVPTSLTTAYKIN